MVKKIILTGPESSGKTTLAKQLATHFQTTWLPEYAREYLENLGRSYTEGDLYEIAKGQFLNEKKAEETAIMADENILIFDTSFLVLKIWSIFKYGRCHPFVLEQLKKQTDVFYILCGTEIAWQFDPLRENPNQRTILYDIYKKELKERKVQFIEVVGSKEERLNQSIEALVNL